MSTVGLRLCEVRCGAVRQQRHLADEVRWIWPDVIFLYVTVRHFMLI